MPASKKWVSTGTFEGQYRYFFWRYHRRYGKNILNLTSLLTCF